MTMHSQCETEDSHRCSLKESLVPRATVSRGFLAHDVHTDPVLIQKIHSAVETCQATRESPETRAVNGVLENLHTCGLDEVLLERDDGSVIRTPVNPAWVGRGENKMAEKCSKNLPHFDSMSENAVKGIEKPVTTSDCGCNVDSGSVAPSWIVGCAVHVLSQSERNAEK